MSLRRFKNKHDNNAHEDDGDHADDDIAENGVDSHDEG